MLYRKGWQGCTQGFRSLASILAVACVLLASCTEGNREPTEADLSAFGIFVDSLDTSLEGKWFSRMGMSDDVDELLSFLRSELPRHGLDTTAFSIPQIAEDMDVVRRTLSV